MTGGRAAVFHLRPNGESFRGDPAAQSIVSPGIAGKTVAELVRVQKPHRILTNPATHVTVVSRSQPVFRLMIDFSCNSAAARSRDTRDSESFST